MKIAIIGAGLSACNLYNCLKKEHEITLFEKSRGTGGRLSTKYFDDKFVDHGTPFIKTEDKKLKNLLDDLCNEDTFRLENNVYFPNKGMNKICASLINKKDLISKCKINKIYKQNNKWHLQNEQNDIYLNFDFLIFTMPTPQILDFDDLLIEKIKNKLKEIEYESVATIILTSKNKIDIDIKKLEDLNIFKKIINNSKKYNYKDFSSFVLHISENFLNENLGLDKKEIFEKVYKKIEECLKIKIKNSFNIHEHFWKYAFAKKVLDNEFLIDESSSLAICGDYFQKENLESSFHSSLNLANRIKRIKININ